MHSLVCKSLGLICGLLAALAVLLDAAHADDLRPIVTHSIDSPHQSKKVFIRVLLPQSLEHGKKYPVIYVLPVEAGTNSRFGDGMLEIEKHNLHNKHQVIFVSPTFVNTPWYADHPTNPKLRQESHFLKVVLPFVEKTYPVMQTSNGRLLLGFSKSGAGAFALLLRHPQTFGKALAFDSPLMRESLRKGRDIFATQENFEQYAVPQLLRQKAEQFRGEKRFILLGKGFLNKFHVQAHAILEQMKIAHRHR